QVDRDGLEGDAQLLQRPAGANRSGRGELVQLHPSLLCRPRRPTALGSPLQSIEPGRYRQSVVRPPGRPPPRDDVDPLLSRGRELLEPRVTELREFDQVAVRILYGGRPEEPGVPRRIEERHTLRLQAPGKGLDVERGERELHRANAAATIRERLDRMDREV